MATYTPVQRALIAASVLRIKRELLLPIITARPVAGDKRIPLNVQSFGELHDYCDANCLGGFCDDESTDRTLSAYNTAFPGELQHGIATAGAHDAMNFVQCRIDHWLATGNMARDAAACARMTTEQLECMFDDSRAGEAYSMVQDLDARCNLWTHSSEEARRVDALLVTTCVDLTDEHTHETTARDTAETYASEGVSVVILNCPNDDRRPRYTVRVYEGPDAERLAREADEGYGLWIDGEEVTQ